MSNIFSLCYYLETGNIQFSQINPCLFWRCLNVICILLTYNTWMSYMFSQRNSIRVLWIILMDTTDILHCILLFWFDLKVFKLQICCYVQERTCTWCFLKAVYLLYYDQFICWSKVRGLLINFNVNRYYKFIDYRMISLLGSMINNNATGFFFNNALYFFHIHYGKIQREQITT